MGFFTSSFRKRHFKYVKHTREFSSRSPTHEVGFAFTRTDLSKWRCSAIVYWCTWISANRPQALWASWYHHKLMLLPVLVSSCFFTLLLHFGHFGEDFVNEVYSWSSFSLSSHHMCVILTIFKGVEAIAAAHSPFAVCSDWGEWQKKTCSKCRNHILSHSVSTFRYTALRV